MASDPGETKDSSTGNPDAKASLVDALGLQFKPETASIHIWISGYEHLNHRFTGKITIPGGIDKIQTFLLESGDSYSVSGETVSFTISSYVSAKSIPKDELAPPGVLPLPLPLKHLMITPLKSLESVDASVKVDGKVSKDRFFPRADKLAFATGSETVKLSDFPIIPQLPAPSDFQRDSFFMWASQGKQDETPSYQELDPQIKEQLKALGYIN